ncbi:MAG: hypothetical protein AAF587_07625 [Bacteroidota bacterium]
MLWLDLRLLLRHHILTVAILVTLTYSLILLYLPASIPFRGELMTLLLLTDPSMLGFMFVGVMVLFEKDSATLKALVVTPLKSWQYIWSKAISLTAIAMICGMTMGYIGHSEGLQPLYLLFAIGYASLIFVFIGLIGVVRVHTLNQYLVLIPFCLIPLLPPVLGLFGVGETILWYLFPTHAILILYQASWHVVPFPDVVYAFLYPICWIAGLYFWAQKSFAIHLSFYGD